MPQENDVVRATEDQLNAVARTKWEYLIVGAGIAGLSLGEALSRRSSARVLLIEGKRAGSGASTRNVGRLTHAGCASHLRVELARKSKDTLISLQAQFKHNIILQRLGEVTVLYREGELEHFERKVLPSMREVGLKGRLIPGEKIKTHIPGYNIEGAVGAFVTDETFVVHPDALLMGLVKALRTRGIKIIENAYVNRLVVEGGLVSGVLVGEHLIEADRVILCCGSAASDFLARVGWITPLEIRRHQTIVIDNIVDPGWPVIRWTGPISSGSCHRTARGEVLAACQHPQGERVNNNQTSLEFVLRTAEQLYQHLPALSRGSILRQWGGVTTYAPDDLPYAGPVPDIQGLWALYGINGFTIYPLLADVLSLALLEFNQDPIMVNFALSTERGVRSVL